jgi:hypothetical protein
MKLTILVAASVASSVAVASAQPAAPNASAPSHWFPSNLSDTESARYTLCNLPNTGLRMWWYNSRSDGPFGCYGDPDRAWAMLNSYRSGGLENVHWKYTTVLVDNQCLVDWEYYDKDGTTLIAKIRGSTTLERDTRRWCALPVYRSGGAMAKQWGFCSCWSEGP